ncbi:putative U1 small nuclear ribonucleoparticle-associated protein [Tieghemostelium lacteum]|uniref:Putative U1 small nuclear ribonucleoparticle-associated protein n=1 Tax=Tieghemostelium lacteum TaxID=361077 RepID=A0A151Z386_TIELA|nr:putative U1 small nuclear ribonucleoparticle-associated protein [Tieghemostelium lacteum]|eukprot:KYQ88408.1 putative U1 small nuclear ribonucleoparticle-associated protein [Tieghemostelium lacteum]
MEALRAQLDEFLGKDRNLLPKDRVKTESHFTDADICKYYLCGLCPNELFTNANIHDLAPCSKLHIEGCVKQYQNSKDKEVYDYERDWVRLLENLISENDKKIKKNKERLAANPNENIQDEDLELDRELNQRIEEMDKQIQIYLKMVEDLGEEGKITEAQQTMEIVEDLKAKKIELQREEMIAHEKNENKKMSVCEICGALLFVGDKEKRSISHLEGKKHIGFERIRKVMEDYYKTKNRQPRHFGGGGGYYNRDRNYHGGGGGGGGGGDGGNYHGGGGYHNRENRDHHGGGGGNRYEPYGGSNRGQGDRERRTYNFEYRDDNRGNSGYRGGNGNDDNRSYRNDDHHFNNNRGRDNNSNGSYNHDNYQRSSRDREDDRRKR